MAWQLRIRPVATSLQSVAFSAAPNVRPMSAQENPAERARAIDSPRALSNATVAAQHSRRPSSGFVRQSPSALARNRRPCPTIRSRLVPVIKSHLPQLAVTFSINGAATIVQPAARRSGRSEGVFRAGTRGGWPRRPSTPTPMGKSFRSRGEPETLAAHLQGCGRGSGCDRADGDR
jgi:hypothetical protein